MEFPYFRYLPNKGKELSGALSDRNRTEISREVVQFISAVAGQIQEINNLRDEMMAEAEEDFTALFEHYKIIKESLLSVSLYALHCTTVVFITYKMCDTL